MGIRSVTAAVCLFWGMMAAGAQAQNASPTMADVYSQDDLAGMEKALAQKADASGLATETVKKYGSDYTLLAFRSASGKAEQHARFADFYFVLEGKATLVTGGQLVNQKTTEPGEIRAESIQGGKQSVLKKGDVAHIPPNTPHQLLLDPGATFHYFVVKVQEVE